MSRRLSRRSPLHARARAAARAPGVLAVLAVSLVFAPSALAAGGEPTVSGARATSITENSATLEAQVNPGGGNTTYEFWLVYRTCQGSGVQCQEITDERVGEGLLAPGDSAQTVSVDLTHLQPGYSYSYWVVASSSAGKAESPHSEFETQPAGACDGGCPYKPEISSAELEATKLIAEQIFMEIEAKRQQAAREHDEQQAREDAARYAAEAAELKRVEEEEAAADARSNVVAGCVVPSLKGDTLSKAQRALGKAHCRLGGVSRYEKGHSGRLVVTRQSVSAGRKLPLDTRVGVTLGRSIRRG